MTNNTIIIEKLREVKTGIFTEVMEQINKIESISSYFKHTNLKIYDVSYYLYKAVESGLITDEQSLYIFNDICELEYKNFEDWENENLNYVERSYINRTSSFYYNSNWYGDIVENGILEDLLEGNEVLKESLKGLDVNLYNYLLGIDERFNCELEVVDFLDEIENDIEYLELLSDDLETVFDIVENAKKAYDYLNVYKTQQNEYALAESYLKHEITEYVAVEKAEKLFNELILKIEKLNDVNSIELENSLSDHEYIIGVKINGSILFTDNSLKCNHEFSNLLADTTLTIFEDMINEKFNL